MAQFKSLFLGQSPRYPNTNAVTGMVAGLATVTPAAGFVGPMGALVIGTLGGGACLVAASVLKRGLKIDDSLDVVAVHLVGGVLGTVLAGVFASKSLGAFSGQEDIAIVGQVGVQLLGVLVTVLYTGVATWVILVLVSAAVGAKGRSATRSERIVVQNHDTKPSDSTVRLQEGSRAGRDVEEALGENY